MPVFAAPQIAHKNDCGLPHQKPLRQSKPYKTGTLYRLATLLLFCVLRHPASDWASADFRRVEWRDCRRSGRQGGKSLEISFRLCVQNREIGSGGIVAGDRLFVAEGFASNPAVCRNASIRGHFVVCAFSLYRYCSHCARLMLWRDESGSFSGETR